MLGVGRTTLNLNGVAEVSDRLGVSRQRVHQLAQRSHFPRPLVQLKQGYIWWKADIDAWISVHRPELLGGDDEEN